MHVSFTSAFAASITALLFATPQALAQDECATAIPIFAGANGPFTNAGATASTTLPAPSCVAGSFNNDIWLVFQSLCAGSTTIDTCATPGAASDSVMQVYNGAAGCAGLTLVACNDDACGLSGFQSSVTFATTIGGVYFVRLTAGGRSVTRKCVKIK